MDKGGRISPRGARTGMRINVQELEDVSFTNLTGGQVLQYSSTTGTWKNAFFAGDWTLLDAGKSNTVYNTVLIGRERGSIACGQSGSVDIDDIYDGGAADT